LARQSPRPRPGSARRSWKSGIRAEHCGRRSSLARAKRPERCRAAFAFRDRRPNRRTRQERAERGLDHTPSVAKPPCRREHKEIPAVSCPPLGSEDGIVSVQTNTLIEAETGFATAT